METIKDTLTRYPLFIVTVILALLLLLVTGLYLRVDTRGPIVDVPLNLAELSTEDQESLRAEVLDALSYIMVLPADQNPIMATVANAEQLRAEQAFYANAVDGDVLLVFQASNQAVIYRASERKIVNAGSLVVN